VLLHVPCLYFVWLHRQEQRYLLSLRLLQSERALRKSADRCYDQRKVLLRVTRRHLKRVTKHVEYQRLQLAELLEEQAHLKIVVRHHAKTQRSPHANTVVGSLRVLRATSASRVCLL